MTVKAVLEKRVPQFLSKGVGIAVGIINCGERSTYGFGETRDGQFTPPNGRTLYEIGSTTKVFTTTLLATLVVEKGLDLQQPVREFLPEVPTLPQSITLQSLATHTSGLPRLPDNIWDSFHQNLRNPYANYRERNLLEYLQSVKESDLKHTGGLIRYSNLGMGLLGFVLARHLRMSYEQAIQQWICSRLMLPDTATALTSEQEERLSAAHDGTGRLTSNFDMPVLAGAGALRSTVDDLSRFLWAHLSPPQAFLDVANLTLRLFNREFAREPGLLGFFARMKKRLPQRALPNLQSLGIGLGWMHARLQTSGAEVWIHNGSTFGYRSFAGLAPASNTAVVVLNNRGSSRLDFVLSRYTVDSLGIEVLEALQRSTQGY
jgi:serine-type D-Ala-D-Ala carboxypeptidase/endopeptidase